MKTIRRFMMPKDEELLFKLKYGHRPPITAFNATIRSPQGGVEIFRIITNYPFEKQGEIIKTIQNQELTNPVF